MEFRCVFDRHENTNIETYRQHFKKQTHFKKPTKGHLFQAMVFPGVIYGYESWTIKKAEC